MKGNGIIDLGDGKKIVDLGRGKIYLGKEGGKAEIFLTRDELVDLCYSFLLYGYPKELRHKTEPLFDLLSEAESDLDGTGVLKLENGRLTLGYKNRYEDITEIAKEEGFDFYRFAYDIGLERTGLAGGEFNGNIYSKEEKSKDTSRDKVRKQLKACAIIGIIGMGILSGIGIKNEFDSHKITLKELSKNSSLLKNIDPNKSVFLPDEKGKDLMEKINLNIVPYDKFYIGNLSENDDKKIAAYY